MKYFKRLGIAIIFDVVALLASAVFYLLASIVPFGEGMRIPIFICLLISGFLDIGRYLSSYKTSVLFDHSSLLIGGIKIGLSIMSLLAVNPTNYVFFIIFGFLMAASGVSHFENMMIMQRVKGILWQATIYLSVLVTGIGIVMLIAGPPGIDRARQVYALCLVVEALASLLEIFLLNKKQTELHEAALKIADDVKEAIKKDGPPQSDGKTVINLLPLQNVNTLSAEEVKKLQEDGTLPNAASSLSVSAKPADKITYKEGSPKDESREDGKEEKTGKKVLFPDDLV